MVIVTLAQLQAHLRLPVGVSSPPTDAETDLQAKLDAAHGIVLDYLARPTDAAWTATIASWEIGFSPATVPPPAIVAAILLQAAELYGFRGDDLETVPRTAPGDLAQPVKALLYRWRQPVLA